MNTPAQTARRRRPRRHPLPTARLVSVRITWTTVGRATFNPGEHYLGLPPAYEGGPWELTHPATAERCCFTSREIYDPRAAA